MSIPENTVETGGITRTSQYDTLYNNSVLCDTGGTPGGAQSIPGHKTFSDGITASATCSFINAPTAYYSPVSGEESAGTYHALSGLGFIVSGANVYISDNISVDISPYVPAGAKAVQVFLTIFNDTTSATDASEAYVWDYDIGNYATAGTNSVYTNGVKVRLTRVPASGYTSNYVHANVEGIVSLTGSSRRLYYGQQAYGSTYYLYIGLKGYYI